MFPSTASAIELTLWEEEQAHIQAVLDEAIGRFELQNPSIEVQRSHFKTEDLRTKFQIAGLSKSGADLILAPNDFAGVFSIMGIIHPVETFLQKNRFSREVIAAITDDKGHSWGIPINQGNHLILYVNRRLIPKAPESIEELLSAAKKVSNPDKNVFGLAFNILEPFWVVPFLGGYGTIPIQDSRPNLDNQAMVKTLRLLREFKFHSKIVPLDCDYSCAETLFLEEKAAITINGDWAIAKLHSALKDDLIIAPLPKIGSRWMKPMVSGKYFMFSRKLNGMRMDAAKKFVEFMTSEEIQIFLAKKSRRLPSLKKLLGSKTIKGDPVLSDSLAAMQHAQPMPMQVEMRAVWDAIRPQLQEVMAGRQRPKSAVKIMQKDAETKIKGMGL